MLPTTKKGSEQQTLAMTGDSIYKAMKIATKTGDYLVSRVSKQLQNLGEEFQQAGQAVIKELKEFAKEQSLSSIGGNVWSGEFSPLINKVKEGIDIAKEVKEQIQDAAVKIDVALNDASELVRGFSSSGKALTGKLATSFDNLLNSWFAKNGLLSMASVIYEADEDGKIRENAQGKPVHAEPSKVRQVLNGFQKYLKSLGIQANLKQHQMPQPQTEAQKAAGKAPEAGKKASAAKPKSEEPRKDSPARGQHL